jgi:diguanylate cyclase (GGDEF)-like protein
MGIIRANIQNVRLLVLGVLVVIAAGAPARLRSLAPRELTEVREIRALTPQQAAQARPVRLRGIVTVPSGWKNSFFFQDGTAGISVDRSQASPQVQPGQLVEIRGVTGPGGFAPVVIAASVRVLGKGTLPPARRFESSELASGKQDSQWLAIRGIVRSAAVRPILDRPVLFLEIDMGGGNLVSVRVLNFSGSDWSHLPASTVTARGVCGTDFNDRRQFIGLRMFVASLGDIKVEQPAPADPFDLPLRPLSGLMRFENREGAISRIKVRGVVTYSDSGQRFYLQDGNEGVFVQSTQAFAGALGSPMEVVGYPAVGRYSPTLVDAVFRVEGAAHPLAGLPQRASAMIALDENGSPSAPYDAVLVQLKGRLLEEVPGTDEDLLLLRDGATVFTARLPRTNPHRRTLEVGSLLSLTGVCSAKANEAHEARSFELLLRSPADLVVVERPFWWTPTHAGWVAGFLALVILVMSLWQAIVRRHERLRALAFTDHLTGLYNRRGFFLLAGHQWQLALRNNTSLLLFYIDLDHFKEINDSLGHKVGDQALRDCAAVLRECFRSTDIIARIGGDEFAITTEDASPESRAMLEARLAEAVAQKNNEAGRSYKLSLSVGVLMCDLPMQDLSIDDLLAKADSQMYRQKRKHREKM